MSGLTTTNESTLSNTRLLEWQSVPNKRGSMLRARSITILILLLTLGVFLYVVLRPLSSPTLTVISVGPKAATDGSIGSATRIALTSQRRFQDFANTIPTAHVQDSISFSNQATILDENDGEGRAPLLLHVVGSAKVQKDSALMESPRADSDSKRGLLNISDLLTRLEASNATAIVLLDIIDDLKREIGVLPELTAWQFARCVDQKVAAMQHGKVLVLVQHSQVGNLSDAANEITSPLTVNFQEAFRPESDANQDAKLSAGEILDVLVPLKENKNHPTPVVYSTVARSKWHQVVLTPTFDPVIDDGAIAEESKKSGSSVATSKAEIPVTAESRSLKAATPTLALAIAMHASGLATNQSESALEISEQLSGLLNIDSLESDARAWLATPKISAVHWDEIEWTRIVLAQEIAWPLKRLLIHSRILANQVALKPTVRDWYPEAWDGVQWKRLDAERTLLSPVRHDDQTYIRLQTEEAIRQYTQLASRAAAIDDANLLCETIRNHVDLEIAKPIRARSSQDDVVCQLLKDTADLQSWLDHRHGDTVHECIQLIESITQRRRVVGGDAASSERVPIQGLGDRFVENTRIRISRSLLAIELLRHRNNDTVLKGLRDSAERAIDVLSSSSSAQDEIIESTTAFQIEAKKLKAEKRVSDTGTNSDGTDESWARILNSLAEDAQRFASDATPEERERFMQDNSRYTRLSLAMGQSTTTRIANDFRIDVLTRGSLAVSDHVAVDISVQRLSETAESGWLEIEYDDETVTIDLAPPGDTRSSTPVDLRPIGSRDYRSVATQHQTSGRAVDPSAANRITHAVLHRILAPTSGFRPKRTAINVRWVTKDSVYRSCIPFKLPLPEIANIAIGSVPDISNEISLESLGWTMHANRIDYQRLNIQPADDETKNVSIRLLGWHEPSQIVPPPMTKEDAVAWLAAHAQPAILANLPSLTLQQGSPVPVLFPPQKLDPALPPTTVGSLWCEVTDTDRNIVQMIDISPHVYRPSALVRPSVSYDHSSQTISLIVQDVPSRFAHGETHLHIEASDVLTGKTIARADALLTPGSTVARTLSVAAAAGHSVRVHVTVDQWPSAFVYEFDSKRSHTEIPAAKDHAAIAIVQPTKEIIVDPASSTVEADVWVDVSDNVFRYGADTVTLGLDTNNDRFLIDDPKVSVSTPVGIHFDWAGINDKGHVGVHSHVGPHRLQVPVGVIRDRRVALAAKLQQGDSVHWSPTLAVVFDSSAPQVKDVEFVSTLPAVLGTAIDMRISIDDEGLSGAASVRGGWAVDGGQEFTSAVKPVPAQKLGDARWALALATDKLASGVHQILIQATDRAGNSSEVKAISIPVRSAAEWLAEEEKQTTVVRGKITYVARPVADMKVALKPKPKEKEKDSDSAEKEASDLAEASKFEQVVQTTKQGEFQFSDVIEGDYQLSVEGLYQGMKYRKQIEIAVKPPEPSTLPTIRID